MSKLYKYKNVIAAIILFVSIFYIFNFKNINNNYVNAAEEGFTEDDFLKTDGTKIVNQNGKEVVLRGYNLGLWLSRSFWGLPIASDYNSIDCDRYSSVNSIQMDYEMFTNKNIQDYAKNIQDYAKNNDEKLADVVTELNNKFYANQITEKDLDIIKATGANHVRVPIEWTFFMRPQFISADVKNCTNKDDEGKCLCEKGDLCGCLDDVGYNNYGALSYRDTTLPDANEDDKRFLEQRLSILNNLVEMCKARRIYVIFDIHVAPGGLNGGGFREGPLFFEKGTDGDARRNCVLRIWDLISNKFKEEATIAGYDIVNEPGVFNPNSETYIDIIEFYQTAYTTIRNNNDNHIIIFEGIVKSYSNSGVDILRDENGKTIPDAMGLPLIEGINSQNVIDNARKYNQDVEKYNKQVEEYNKQVEEYNKTVEDKEEIIQEDREYIKQVEYYNAQVEAYNKDVVEIKNNEAEVEKYKKIKKDKKQTIRIIDKTEGWNNIIYSKHDYFFNFNNAKEDEGKEEEWQKDNPPIEKMKARIDKAIEDTNYFEEYYNVPIWIGEFSCHAYYNDLNGNVVGTFYDGENRFSLNKEFTEEIWNYQMDLYEENNISYAAWTYKACWEDYFGLVYYGSPKGRINLKTAEYEKIEEKFSSTSEDSMNYNSTFHNYFSKRLQIFEGVDISAKGDGSVIAKLSNDKKLLTISGNGQMADFSDIPIEDCEKYENGKSTVPPWYVYKEYITGIEIGAEITNIGDMAFIGCSNIKNIWLSQYNKNYKVEDGILFNIAGTKLIKYPVGREETAYTIPETVTSIGNCAFEGAPLQSIEITGNVTEIGERAFTGCSKLQNIYVYGSNENYAGMEGVLYNKEGTKLIKYPEGRTETAFTIPDDVTSIGNYAFEGTPLQSIEIKGNVTEIGDNAFTGCSKLKNIYVYASNENYAGIDGVLYNKAGTKLIKYPEGREETAFTIPEIVTSIGNYAFKGSPLQSIEITGNVTETGDRAFTGCSGLKSIVITGNVTEIGDGFFTSCSKLKNIYVYASNENYAGIDGILFNKAKVGTKLIKYPAGREEKTYTTPETVTSIGDYAFEGTSLQNITITSQVTEIGERSFVGCSKLQNIYVYKSNGNYAGIDGILFNKAGTKLIKYPEGRTETAYTIPDDVTSIGNYAFEGAPLQSIEIKGNVTEIGERSFVGCSKLQNIYVYKSNGNYAGIDGILFNKAGTKLIKYPEGRTETAYTIPDDVTSIENYAFEGSPLQSIEIKGNVTEVGERAFGDCNNLKNIYVYGSNENYTGIDGVLYNKEGTKLIKYPEGKENAEYIITSNVTSIGNYAFEGIPLMTIIIPKDVTEIGENVFKDNNLTIICKSGSAIETYAINNGIKYLLDKGFPKITFTTNGTSETVKEATTTVEVEDTGTGTVTGIDYTNLKYYWGKRSEGVEASELKNLGKSFTENQTIKTPNQEGTYYLWILARDKVGNENIVRSEGFNIDKLGPTAQVINSGSGLVTITTHEQVQPVDGWDLSEDKKSLTKQYSSHLTETVVLKDLLGNETSVEVTVEHDMEEATCTEQGKCKLQGCTYTTEALGHSYTNYVSNDDATCTEDGTETAKCDRCDETHTRDVVGSKLGHDYESEVTEATCTEKGYTTHTCKVCQDSYIDEEVEALGHSYTNYVSNDDATCTEDGTETAKCDRCDETHTRDVVGSKLDHDYESEVTEATCTEKGYTTYTCKVCQDSYIDEEVEALGHSYTNYVSNDDATCTEDGTETAKCDRCDETHTRDVEGSKLGHDYENGTCTRCGEKEPKVKVTSEKYEIGEEYITKISPKTKAEGLIKNLETNASDIKIYTKDKKEVKANELLGTGMQLELKLGKEKRTFTLVVAGDINGDREVKISDMTIINRYRLHRRTLEKAELLAGDVTGDGIVNIKDIVKINRYRLNKITSL